ncbi:MAG: hypothetical protein ABIG45_06685 [Bacillota bacterium]
MSVDMGDGVLLSEYEGQTLQDVLRFELKSDQTVLLNSFGTQQEGTWLPTGGGIAVNMDNQVVAFTYTDDQLVNVDDGVTMYFSRAGAETSQGGFSTLVNLGKDDTAPKFEYAGAWRCNAYIASGVSYDINLFFPDGITMTLNEDGTGSVQLTPDYAETITWSEADGAITMDGSYMLFDPLWDPETQILSLCYATDIVRINFEKVGAEPTDGPISVSALPQVYTCDYFSAAFPQTWVQDEYNTYNWDQYYSAQYNLNDENGWSVGSVRITVGVEEVVYYRNQLDTLLDDAYQAGRDALDEVTIGGIPFKGTTYGDYWYYTDYTARIPEASITISINISSPEKIEDVLADILASIRFTYPIPDPPHVDPPMPEDGVPYQPSPTTINVGGFDLKAEWLAAGESIVPRDTYNGSIAVIGNTVYILTGQKLYALDRSGSMLTATGKPLMLEDDYQFLSATWDGLLYITNGYYQGLTLKDGALENFDMESFLAMSPDGLWGLSYWSSSDVKKITVTADGLATKDWTLKNLSDDATRQGRFSSADYITITADHVFVAGPDTLSGGATRIAMYDFDGNELATFGAADWMEDSAISSVAGIVETGNGILVQDGFYQFYLLFALDGTYLGRVRCDDLLGTDYPWPIGMTASENGALALLSQEREDGSATELLVFEITGF